MNVIFNASLLYRHFFFSCMVWFMVFNATFNNISVISWRSVLLVVETGVPEENPLSHVTDNFYHIMLYRTGVELTTLVVIGTDCTGSCKSNYHTKTTTTAPLLVYIDGICNNHCLYVLFTIFSITLDNVNFIYVSVSLTLTMLHLLHISINSAVLF